MKIKLPDFYVMSIGEKIEVDYQEILEEFLKKLKNTSKLRDMISVHGVQKLSFLYLIKFTGMF
jgi:hypothetical protein